MSLLILFPRDDKDCSKAANKNSQLCATGTSTSTLAICLAVILPVFFIGIFLGYFAWRAYKKNKKEALEDDDPDFNGDNIVLPDMLDDKDSDQGRYRTAGGNPGANPFTYASASSVQLPQPAATNPFGDSKHNNGRDMNQKTQPSYMYNHPEMRSQASFPPTLHNHNAVESIVLPYADETGSRRSLEELSRKLGGDYGGYRVPERKLESESASMIQSMASKSMLSLSQDAKRGETLHSANSRTSRNPITHSDASNLEEQRHSQSSQNSKYSENSKKSTYSENPKGSESPEDSKNLKNTTITSAGDDTSGKRLQMEAAERYEAGNSGSGWMEDAERGTYSISIPARATARGLGDVPQAPGAAGQDHAEDSGAAEIYGDPRRAHNTARTLLMRGKTPEPQSTAEDNDHVGYNFMAGHSCDPGRRAFAKAETHTSSSGDYSSDKYHSSDVGSSDVDRSNTMQSMSQMTYQTPNESVQSSPNASSGEKHAPLISVEQDVYGGYGSGNGYGREGIEEVMEDAGDARDDVGGGKQAVTVSEPSGEESLNDRSINGSSAKDTASLVRVRSKVGRKQLLTVNGGSEGDARENAEEEDQFSRMKSVYKVYFSRDSSISSRSSRSEYKFDATGADLPPLPDIAISNEQGETQSGSEHSDASPRMNGSSKAVADNNYARQGDGSNTYVKSDYGNSTYTKDGYKNVDGSSVYGISIYGKSMYGSNTDVNSGYQGNTDVNSGYQGNTDVNSGYQGNTDVNSGYQGNIDVNSGYQGSGDVTSGYQGSGDVNSGYQSNTDVTSSYQDSGDINSTYQYNSDANNTYQNNPDANSTYQNNTYANSGYQNNTYANSGYQSKEDVNGGYQNNAYANSGYQNNTYANSAYQSNVDVNSAYQSNADTSSSYQGNASNPPRPALTVNTNPESRMSTASYSSSVYVPATTPNPNEGYYPHQQMQYMVNQQQQEQRMQMRQMQQMQQMPMQQMPMQQMPMQQMPYDYAYQQPPMQQEPPLQAPKITQKKLEKLPSPHQFSNRNSTLETFIDFNDRQKLPQKGVIASPHMKSNLSQMPWSKTSSNLSPHQIDESMMIHSPVEITGKKRYMPPGSFENQIRKISPNMSRIGSRSQFSPQINNFQPDPAQGYRPQVSNVGM